MRLATVLGLAIMLVGCSKSSVEMLKTGDAHVCAKRDVMEQLFVVMRDNASAQENNDLFPNYDQMVQRWMKEIKFSADSVTSKDVDAPNEKITCNATVHIKGAGADQEQDPSVDYRVTADLSTGRVIVTADPASAIPALNIVLEQVSKSDFQDAQNQRVDENLAKIAGFEDQWLAGHQDDVRAKRTAMTAELTAAGISEQQRNKIFEEELLKDMCFSGSDDLRPLACSRRDSLHDEIEKIEGFCNPDYSKWVRCGQGVPTIGQAPPGRFTPAEVALINEADDLNDKCRDTHPEVCNQRDAFYEKLKGQNLCWGPDDAIEADKHWIRCH